MARFIILVFLVAMAVAVIAAPVEEEESAHLRVRRVTCDLLSYGGKVGDSACAARCLVTGKKGGHCEGGVCNCRN